MKTSEQRWVVVASETVDGETTCQVVSEEYDTPEEAEVFAADAAYSCPSLTVEVATVEEAAQVVAE